MRKFISTIICLVIAASVFSACDKKKNDIKIINNNKLKIVTTIFPEYDWVKNILGDKVGSAEITMLLDNGVDLHSYQPTASDMIKISECNLFIYVGGESDKWVKDALKETTNKNIKVINLLEILGSSAKHEEIIEGMEHKHEDGHEDEHDHEHEHEYDEHVWLSLKTTKLFVSSIANTIANIDSANAEIYKSNASAYIQKLNMLDEKYQDTVNKAKFKTVIFGDRFPFRYLTDDYKLTYFAAFSGCSAETEASFETVSFLSKKADELKVPCILTIEGTNHKIAETIMSNTKEKNQKILSLDSMQSTTSADVRNGTTYLSVMESNLETLKKALG